MLPEARVEGNKIAFRRDSYHYCSANVTANVSNISPSLQITCIEALLIGAVPLWCINVEHHGH